MKLELYSAHQRALLFAKLSKLSYEDEASFWGFTSVCISQEGSEVYLLKNATDCAVICRGTELTSLEDLYADIRFLPTQSSNGWAHRGFEAAVDNIWQHVGAWIERHAHTHTLWAAGHSLGAAMATIIANRSPHIFELHTFGSPRVLLVGSKRDLDTRHHRWVNSSDIVTRLPLFPYWHVGELHYFNHEGVETKPSWQTLLADRFKGGSFRKHSIDSYIARLS